MQTDTESILRQTHGEMLLRYMVLCRTQITVRIHHNRINKNIQQKALFANQRDMHNETN